MALAYHHWTVTVRVSVVRAPPVGVHVMVMSVAPGETPVMVPPAAVAKPELSAEVANDVAPAGVLTVRVEPTARLTLWAPAEGL
jgi:hypothetical protein